MSARRLHALEEAELSLARRQRAVDAVRELLSAVGADPDRAGMQRTPDRVADYYLAMFAHDGEDPAAELGTPIPSDETGGDGVVAMHAIPFRSFCEHHLLPFSGSVDIAYVPSRRLAGLSRLVGVVRSAAARPQLQERLTDDIAGALVRVLHPRGVEVRVRATHSCVAVGEPQGSDCVVLTTATRGVPVAWG